MGNDTLWKNFCGAVKRPDLLADARFVTNGDRTKYYADLIPELERMLEARTCDEWLAVLEKAGVPAAPVNTVDKVMKDRQLKARNMFVTVEDEKAGTVTVPGNPIKMESIPETATRQKAPAVGEHTDSILRAVLGLDDDAIESLRTQGAI